MDAKLVTDDQKAQCLMATRAGLRQIRQHGDDLLSCTVITDETSIHHYEPESKRPSMEWKHVTSLTKAKLKSQLAVGKVMLTVFWDIRGPATISFLQKGTSVNAENCCELLNMVKRDIRSKQRGVLSNGVIFLQDNARPYTTARTLAKINNMG